MLAQQAWQQPSILHKGVTGHDSVKIKILNKQDRSIYKNRQAWVGALSAGWAVGSLVVLNEAWYKQYPKTPFHTFNDSREWLQVDKAGHAWSAYHVSRAASLLWQWAGAAPHKAVFIGSASSLGYMTIIEYLDAHSQEWGWSWADVGANTAGTLLFAAQQLVWSQQKIQFKFSAVPHRYTESLTQRADNLFGASVPERLLKDYNAQTYWLSTNINSIIGKTSLPAWLNIAVGYGATGLWGGFDNKAVDERGHITFDRRDIRRVRQWYLAPDVDFTKIKTNRKGVKTLLAALNCLKFPAPGLELTGGKLKGRWVAY